MRIIKLAIVSLLMLFVVATGISLLLPSTITVSRAIDVVYSKDKLHNTLTRLSNWKLWIENRDSLPVSINLQSSHQVFVLGSTKAWIASSNADQILSNWQVGNGQILPAEFTLLDHTGSEHITLQWKFVQKVKWYPWEKLASITSEKVLGGFMEASLNNLKKHVEQEVPTVENEQ